MNLQIERMGLDAIESLRQTETAGQPAQAEGESLFASVFQSAIQNVKDTNADVVEAQYLLSTGQLDNPTAAILAMSKYSISVDLLIQLRNRALDAYQELTRLSI